MHLIHYARGETIFQQGSRVSGCYILCHGKVKLVQRTLKGKQQLFKILTPGDMLGEIDLLSGQREHLGYAKTLAETHVGFIEKDNLLQWLRAYPSLSSQLFLRLTREIDAIQERLLETSYGSVRDRLIRLILTLEKRQSRDEENGRLVVDLSREELAEMVGVARETVSRHLSQLKRQGLISYEKGKVIIRDEEGLRKLV